MQAKYEPSIIRKLDRLLHSGKVLGWYATQMFDFGYADIIEWWELRYRWKIDPDILYEGISDFQFILCTFDTLDELKIWCDLHGLDSNKLKIDTPR